MDIINCLSYKNYSKNVKKRWVNNPHHVYDKTEKEMILVTGQFYYGCSGPEETTLGSCNQFDPISIIDTIVSIRDDTHENNKALSIESEGKDRIDRSKNTELVPPDDAESKNPSKEEKPMQPMKKESDTVKTRTNQRKRWGRSG